jgi:hypothetical protein
VCRVETKTFFSFSRKAKMNKFSRNFVSGNFLSSRKVFVFAKVFAKSLFSQIIEKIVVVIFVTFRKLLSRKAKQIFAKFSQKRKQKFSLQP